jgi:hypothetical protein
MTERSQSYDLGRAANPPADWRQVLSSERFAACVVSAVHASLSGLRELSTLRLEPGKRGTLTV